jgi:stage II sporulation protein E
MDLFATIEVAGRVTADHISPDIQKRCVRLKELAVTVNCLFDLYKSNHFWERKVAESREVVAGQLDGIANILTNLAGEIKVDVQMREDIELILRRELIKSGHSVLDLKVLSVGGDKMEVVVSCPSCGGKLQCSREIAPLVAGVLGQRMKVLNSNYCPKKTGEPVCEFRLYPAFNFEVEVGVASVSCETDISGDNHSVLELRDGKFVMILSDGMGVGAKAAQESRATISLLEQLMETGFDKALAAKTVNSVLVVRSPEETFATVDLTIIDLFTGTADFMKIGAVPSFIKRGSQVGIVRSASLPIGILNNIEVDCIQKPLSPDDVVVMVTDGVLEAGRGEGDDEDWVLDTLQQVMTTDPQNIADLILNKAVARNKGTLGDDMTVLVGVVKTVK